MEAEWRDNYEAPLKIVTLRDDEIIKLAKDKKNKDDIEKEKERK